MTPSNQTPASLERTTMSFENPLRTGALALAALVLIAGAIALTPAPARAQADEEPAAEAPPAKKPKAAEEEEEVATPAPKKSKAEAASSGPLAVKVEKQGKELAALRKENDELKKQVRLLYLIVNKLAGLNQAQ